MRFPRITVLVLFALWPAWVSAVTFNVNSTADNPDDFFNGICADSLGKCTLRAAIMEANLGGTDPFVIQLPAGTYTLTRAVTLPDDHSNGDLDVNGALAIYGSGAKKTIIDANHLDRAFRVTTVGEGELTLHNLTIRNGQPSGGHENSGGAILVAGYLELDGCVLDSNSAGNGGAVALLPVGNSLPTLRAERTTFSRNVAAGGAGGAVYGFSAKGRFDACTLSRNSAADGAGIGWGLGQLEVQNTTLFLNEATLYGGGIGVSYATATIINATLGGNGADSDLDGSGSGGGLYAESSTVNLWNSVFANVNDNTRENDDCYTVFTTISSYGANVLRSTSGCAYTGLVYNTDPLLGALKDNGGPTETQMISPSSLAVEGQAGACPALSGLLTVDQRGVKRPIGSKCDLGAVEREPIGDANGDGSVTVADVLYLINFLFAGGPLPLGRANVNGGSTVDVADVLYLINFLFAGGPAPI